MSSVIGQEVKSWIISIVSAIVVAMLIRTFIVELYVVDGPSMQPTLQDGERLVVNKFIYHWRDPLRSEVVIFRYPRDHSRDFIKRVIAVGGMKITLPKRRARNIPSRLCRKGHSLFAATIAEILWTRVSPTWVLFRLNLSKEKPR